MAKQLSVGLHKFLPHHALSVLAGWLADRRWKKVKNRFIAWFISRYGVDMSEAENSDYRDYPTFNEFFTRRLKPDARAIAPNPSVIISPVDGAISELGQITGDRLLQAKNKHFDLTALLGGYADHAELFQDGEFLTAYLAPKDYHRFHMPVAGRLLEMLHVPGRLFSVNPASAAQVDNLFARNERVVCLFETAVGPIAMVIVGAMLVGSIVTTWHGQVTPPTRKTVRRFDYRHDDIALARGEEVGFFKMGSTVILLFPKDSIAWNENLKRDSVIKFGEVIANPI